ncbi:hypothetical protein AVEN_128403-1 [Araneus ventricosus]|uniref:Uncharacterized protein n=1 Tax=Araneus ventricosus TaxID=182803 RepID=A0A4Y2EJB0_ARAVE|nr:hypothetical protein AVEN_128403-1 [Araneus ventricosus]
MKSTRTRTKNDVIGSRRSEPIILSDFLPQFYQGRVCKYASGSAVRAGCGIFPLVMGQIRSFCGLGSTDPSPAADPDPRIRSDSEKMDL